MNMMKDTNTISPNRTVYEMRRQRAYSVQNWVQIFILPEIKISIIFLRSNTNLYIKPYLNGSCSPIAQ